MKVKDYFGNDVAVYISTAEYYNGNLAVRLWTKDHEPWATLTVNLPDHLKLDKDMAFVDTNNMPEAEEFIREHKLGTPMGVSARSGYCTYPLYKFNLERLRGAK